nr:protein GPR107-like [Ipomoea batatas]
MEKLSHSNPFFHVVYLSLILSLVFPGTKAEKKTINISNDNREVIILEEFRYTNNGRLSINVSSVSINPTTANASRLAFFLSPSPFLGEALHRMNEGSDYCVFDQPYVNPIFTLHHGYPGTSIQKLFSISKAEVYFLFFVNCAKKSSVTMSLSVEMYNIETNGKRNYLSDGSGLLPSIFFASTMAYSLLFLWWAIHCHHYNRKATKTIHILMAALLISRALDSLCLSLEQETIKRTGSPHGWQFLLYFLHTIRSLLLVLVVLLIGAGWTVLKPFVHKEGQAALALGMLVQIVSSVMYILKWETGLFVDGYFAYTILLFILDFVSCWLLLLPIGSTMRELKRNADTEGKAARSLEMLKCFRNLFVGIFVYILITRVALSILKFKASTNGWRDRWVLITVVEQVINVVCFWGIFFMFRPTTRRDDNPFVATEHDEEAARAELEIMYDYTKFYE